MHIYIYELMFIINSAPGFSTKKERKPWTMFIRSISVSKSRWILGLPCSSCLPGASLLPRQPHQRRFLASQNLSSGAAKNAEGQRCTALGAVLFSYSCMSGEEFSRLHSYIQLRPPNHLSQFSRFYVRVPGLWSNMNES